MESSRSVDGGVAAWLSACSHPFARWRCVKGWGWHPGPAATFLNPAHLSRCCGKRFR